MASHDTDDKGNLNGIRALYIYYPIYSIFNYLIAFDKLNEAFKINDAKLHNNGILMFIVFF